MSKIDTSTIIAASNGDKRSFRMIFEHYAPQMRPVALHYARTVFETDDIIQESFMRIYTNLKSYKHEGSFVGWIRRVVVNTALNMRRAGQNLHSIMDPLDSIDENEVVDEDLQDLELAEPSTLMRIIDTLPEGYKMVFSLYVFEDMSHKEIASILGISEGTSRSQYSKSKKYILKLLAKQGNETQDFHSTKESI